MNLIHAHNPRWYLWAFLGLILFQLQSTTNLLVHAQAVPRGDDSTHVPDQAHWARGATVYYQFDSNITDKQKAQIIKGLEYWNDANQSNGVDILYYPGPSTSPLEVAPKILYIENKSLSDNTMMAVLQRNRTDESGNLTMATLVFNQTASIINPSTKRQEAYYNPDKASYATVFEEQTKLQIKGGQISKVP